MAVLPRRNGKRSEKFSRSYIYWRTKDRKEVKKEERR